MVQETGLVATIERSIITYWDCAAFSDYHSTTLRYSEVAAAIARLHLLFQALGVKEGDKIALCGRNCSHWAVAFYAIITYGAVVVPIQNEFRARDVHNIINHSDSVLLFVGDATDHAIALADMPGLRAIISLKDFALSASRCLCATEVAESVAREYAARYPEGVTVEDVHYFHDADPEQLVLLNYTSGTTGFSKGVMIPYRSLASNLFFTQTVLSTGIQHGDNLVSTLPHSHTFGMTCELLFAFAYGLHLHFLTRQPTPSIILSVCQEVHPAMLIAVPLVIEKVVQKSIFPRLERGSANILYRLPLLNNIVKKRIKQWINDELGGNIYQVFTGGAAMNPTIEQFLMDIAFPITSGYGCTETSPMITYSDFSDHVMGSCGTVVPNMEIAISPDKEGTEVGEVLTRGSNMMIGYYKDAARTAEVMDSEGWFHTGDRGRLSPDGHLFLLGRIKNMLLGANGQNIYPEEIEALFDAYEYVGESLVLQEQGRLVVLVYPDQEAIGALAAQEEVTKVLSAQLATLNKSLPKYCAISALRLVDKPFERTAKHSIKRYLYTSEG